MAHRIGGSFAPPIDAATLALYRQLAATADSQPVGEVMLRLCEMVEVFQQTPASSQPGTPHPVGVGTIVPLEEAEVKRIWDYVPWRYECDAYKSLFAEIPAETHKPLRDAAFHLLWFACELERDREPLTSDKL